jgi:serine/threonine-protein kinase
LANLNFAQGHQIDARYIIDSSLGKGGMGVVYRAYDQLVDEDVALKFMHPRRLRSERAQQRFIREAQIARRLRHENIVAVHDVSSTTEGILYLSMEFLQGQSLRTMLRDKRKERRLLDVRLAVRLMSQVLDALDYAHRTVVHRDIKPENVMLMPGEHVKVLDFGLAIAVDVETPETAPEMPQQGVVGTKAYASPEQVSHHAVDHRADIYTAGLLFRELLTLRTPKEEPRDVTATREDVSPSLLRVLKKALHEEKANRWQSAREFNTNLLSAFDTSYRRAAVPEAQAAKGKRASTEDMVYMEGGSFLMGNDAVRTEAPQTEVTVTPYYIDKWAVTNGQYRSYVEATGATAPKFWRQTKFNGSEQPVVGITWEQASAFAEWAGKKLPTEAQWEFAARGKANRKYPWGAEEPASTQCNFGDYMGMPSNITMHEEGATPEGVCDMAGNVNEWTCDEYLPYSTAGKASKKKHGSPRRAARGGAWDSPPEDLRCSARKGIFPESTETTVGFRCVLPA